MNLSSSKAIVILMTLGKSKLIMVIHFYWFWSHLFKWVWTRGLAKKIKTLSIWQKTQEPHKGSMIESVGIKNWLGFPVDKQTSKVQSFISFSDMFFWFVWQKICMIRIMTQKVYITGEISFKWLFFDSIA